MRRTTSRRSVLAGCAAIAATLVGVGARADPAASTDGFYLVVSSPKEEASSAVELPDRHGGSEWIVAPPLMSFAEVAQAEASVSDWGSHYVVLLTLTPVGAVQFGVLSGNHIGARLAIVVDRVVMVAPVIHEPIMGGQLQIDGHFDAREAEELAAHIRANARANIPV